MRDHDCLVFVEVRLRSARRLVQAALTVDVHKQRKLIKTAEWFLARHHSEACRARFDVVGLDCDAEGRLSISWLRDAFQP